MKYTIILLLCVFVVTSCNDDFLNEKPTTEVIPGKFFNTEQDLQMYAVSFYEYLPGGEKLDYEADYPSDDFEGAGELMTQEEEGTVKPADNLGSDGWSWGNLRNINFFLENYERAQISDAEKYHYGGVARLARAVFYFNKLKRFGDVPIIKKALDTNSPELYAARDKRSDVFDFILNDLDFAVDNILEDKTINTYSKWTALAYKSRICLFEGTWRKYHGMSDADEILSEAAVAAKTLIDAKSYTLHNTGKPYSDYAELFTSKEALKDEVILARAYKESVFKHSTNYVFIKTNKGRWAYTKSLIESYLMKDGSSFTSQQGAATIFFNDEVKNRDPRLSQIIRTIDYTRMGSKKKLTTDFGQAPSGYQNIKYVTTENKDNYRENTNDYPIIRYAEVLLNYAEAKAELGQIDQSILDETINLIRDRAGMPHLNMSVDTDPVLADMYPNVNNAVLLEIRRERRNELVAEGFRYDDIRRWKVGHLVRKIYKGMYVPAMETLLDMDGDGKDDVIFVKEQPEEDKKVEGVYYYSFDKNSGLMDVITGEIDPGNTSGYIVRHVNNNRPVFEDYQYLYPIPTPEIILNDKLKQTPGY